VCLRVRANANRRGGYPSAMVQTHEMACALFHHMLTHRKRQPDRSADMGPQVGGEAELAATCMVRVASADDCKCLGEPSPCRVDLSHVSCPKASADEVARGFQTNSVRLWTLEHIKRSTRIQNRVVLRGRSTAVLRSTVDAKESATVQAPVQTASSNHPDTWYQTRKQKRKHAGKGHLKRPDGTSVPRDFFPPPGLPQGNVGTPTKKLIELVGACGASTCGEQVQPFGRCFMLVTMSMIQCVSEHGCDS
jgi:hypothetical protein